MSIYMHVVHNYAILCYVVHASPCVENGGALTYRATNQCCALSLVFIMYTKFLFTAQNVAAAVSY